MLIKAVVLGLLTVTSYQPVPAQTKPSCRGRFSCTTSIDDGITKYGVAVSQDFLKSGAVHYGDVLYIPGYGYRIVNDCMNARVRHSVDMMVFTAAEEKAIGVRHLKVYIVQVSSITDLPGVH